jgi:hypothetical protein
MTDETRRAAADAEAAISGLEGSARETARAIDEAFADAGAGLARSLARAAKDGELTLAELARAVIAAANAGLGAGGASGYDLPGAGFGGGARGASGPGSWPLGAGGLTVNVSVAGEGGSALHRSEAQIAQALARAVSLGFRRG